MTKEGDTMNETVGVCSLSRLCDYWLEMIHLQVKPSTYACYATIIEKHIKPEIGGVQVREFCNGMLFNFIRREQSEGLAGNTLRLIIFLLKAIIRLGVENGLATAEPLRYYVPRAANRNSARLMSQENFEELFLRLTFAGNNFETGLLVSLCTGIRVGELCGLRWEDIDMETGYLKVRRTVSRIRSTNFPAEDFRTGGFSAEDFSSVKRPRTFLYIGAPKTGTSLRDIPLPDFLLLRLRERKGADSAFLLTGTEKCMEPRGVQRRFKNLLRKCGIPDINIHSLRHTFASHWIENGFDSKALSEILGHSSVKITMDIYVHSNMNQKKNYMNKMLAI